MTPDHIAAELKRLNQEWRDAPALDLAKAGRAQRALAEFVAEHAEAIISKLES